MDNLIAANLKQRPLRTVVSIAGISLGVILVVLTVGLARGLTRDSSERQSNVEAEIRFYPNGDLSEILVSNPLMLPSGYASAILHGVEPTQDDPDVTPKPPIPEVTATSPIGIYAQSSNGGIGFELIDGIDYSSFIKTTTLKIIEGRPLSDGRSPDNEYEAMIDRFYAEKYRDADGQPVHIGSRLNLLGHDFKLVGIYEPAVLARVKIPLYTMQRLLGGTENCSYVMIRTTGPDAVDKVVESLNRYYPGNNVVRTQDMPAFYSQGLLPVEIFLDVVIGLAVVISALVILLAMYTTIIERTREIGILKSLGASRGFIIIVIEKEALLISGIGVLFGFMISVIARYMIEAYTRLRIDLQPKWLLIAAAIGLLGGIAGALYPAFRAANIDPIEALSYE